MRRLRSRVATAVAVTLATTGAAGAAEPVLRVGVIGTFAGAHPDIPSGATGPIGGLAARALTYFDGQVRLACLLCVALPTPENGLVTDDVDPEGRPGQRVRFRLRPGLAWDDGAPLTAADFVLAWRVGREAENGYAWRGRLHEEIWAAEALDARTFEIRRRGRSCTPADFRFAPIPSHLEVAAARDPKSYRAASLHLTAPATRGLYAGPYRVAAVDDEGSTVMLARNPHWRGPAPRFERIELVYRPDAPSMRQAIAAGQVDLLTDVNPRVLDGLALDRSRQTPIARPGRSLAQVAVNLDDPVVGDVRVRRALLLALDRERLATLAPPGAAAARSFLSQRFPYFQASLPGPDGPTAARLLDLAGWRLDPDGLRRKADGTPLRLRLAIQRAHLDTPPAQALVDAWRRLGAEVQVEPWSGIGQLTGESPPPLALFGYTLEGGANIDFHVFDSRNVPTSDEVRNGLNVFRYRSPAADRIVAALREACDPAVVEPALRELQVRVAEDLPLLPLFFQPEAHLLPASMVAPHASRVQFVLPQEVENWRFAASPSAAVAPPKP